jgi:hypothetical protein
MAEDMTEEEALYWSDYYTKNPPKTDPSSKDGVFMKRKMNRFSGMDNLTVNYLLTKSIETHKSPEEIIGDLVREKIAAAAV